MTLHSIWPGRPATPTWKATWARGLPWTPSRARSPWETFCLGQFGAGDELLVRALDDLVVQVDFTQEKIKVFESIIRHKHNKTHSDFVYLKADTSIIQ